MRLLFASIHSDLDPSGGAALSTRELLELLAARGADCRALTAGVLDYERETTLMKCSRVRNCRSRGFVPLWVQPVRAMSSTFLTYGGHPASLELMLRGRSRGDRGRVSPARFRIRRPGEPLTSPGRNRYKPKNGSGPAMPPRLRSELCYKVRPCSDRVAIAPERRL